jgi:hypothetical protein
LNISSRNYSISPDWIITTDASDIGLGATISNANNHMSFSKVAAYSDHISLKELSAVHEATKRAPRNTCILYLIDNQSILGMLQHGYSKSRICAPTLRRTRALMNKKGIGPIFRYISSSDNYIADALSRRVNLKIAPVAGDTVYPL